MQIIVPKTLCQNSNKHFYDLSGDYMILEGDGTDGGYASIIEALTLIPPHGLTCEFGVRKGRSSQIIMEQTAGMPNPTHIAVDPYGSIAYYSNKLLPPGTTDYSNQMKLEAMKNLSTIACELGVNLLFLPMEDTEYFKRFSDGVPVYNHIKTIVNEYSFVFVDGQHSLEAVLNAANFFLSRMKSGGIIVFDNADCYDHNIVDELLVKNSFEQMEQLAEPSQLDFKKFYKYIG